MTLSKIKNIFYPVLTRLQQAIKQIYHAINPPQAGEVEYTHYIRTGDCNGCGQCCQDIYLVHHDHVIESVIEFEQLKKRHPDYRHFLPKEETPYGVVFKCSQLLPDNRCGIYNQRPQFCKKYPTEATMLFGGKLSPECSYQFKIKRSFAEILQNKHKLFGAKIGTLLNDVRPESTMLKP